MEDLFCMKLSSYPTCDIVFLTTKFTLKYHDYIIFTLLNHEKNKIKKIKNYIILGYFCHIIVNLISENGKTKKIQNKLKSRDVCVNQCVLYKFLYNKLFLNQIHVVVISIMIYHNRNYKELSPLCIA